MIINNKDALADIKIKEDCSFNTIFCDPPYNLGTRYNINKETGHYEPVGTMKDFMDKWEPGNPSWWDEYFGECYRVLKHGGTMLAFSIDRQQDLFTYYARRNGFEVSQSMYWYFISSFPKSSDAEKNILKRIENEMEKQHGVTDIEWG